MTFSDMVLDAFHGKRFEPKKRLHDFYGYHMHRFPIIGGISFVEVQKRQLCARNPLFNLLKRTPT